MAYRPTELYTISTAEIEKKLKRPGQAGKKE